MLTEDILYGGGFTGRDGSGHHSAGSSGGTGEAQVSLH